MAQLNYAQQEAVEEPGNCLVVACPGSGKTTLLVEKAAYILESNPDTKLVITTFTKDASNSMLDKIKARIRKADTSRVMVGTFHGLSFKQLRQFGVIEKNINILTEPEQMLYAQRAAELSDMPPEIQENAMQIIEKARISLDYGSLEGNIAALIKAYEGLTAQNKSIDFQDLVRLSVSAMRNGIDPLPCTHLFVDEFQDTDALQYEWIKEYKRKGAVVTVVGDDDQSIFGWRHAMGYEGMEGFLKEFGARKIVMDTNYRCRKEILDPSAKLIGHNKARMNKDLNAAKGNGGYITKVVLANSKEEAAEVVRVVRSNPGSWAVLARTNRRLNAIESTLCSSGVPYRRLGSKSLFDYHGAKIALLLCKAANDNTKATGINHVLKWSGLSEATLTALHTHLGNNLASPGKDPKLFGMKFWLSEGVNEHEMKRYREFLTMMNGWKAQISENNRETLVLNGIESWLETACSNSRELEEAMLLIQTLRKLNGPLKNRIDLIEHSKREDTKTEEEKAQPQPVILTTLHGSKGLEWENVWIVGMEDGVVPSEQSTSVSEERRLAYVGFTRAKERLVVSFSGDKTESPFLQEAEIAVNENPGLNA
ncbi:MAG: ATP-dependent helicase [Pseudomonadota bacterium]|nr:ATP-dependent helicase [Pseudomonadota bacterium]